MDIVDRASGNIKLTDEYGTQYAEFAIGQMGDYIV